MAEIVVRVKATDSTTLPQYATLGSSGMDIRASKSVLIKAGERVCVPTGLFFEIPLGFEAQVRPRSGLAIKDGVTVLNAPGTIDSDYRGELCVILANLGKEDFKITEGDRIAQIVFAAVTRASLERVDELDETERASSGFGSTGRS